MSRQHGDITGLLLGGERVVLVTGGQAARQVLVDDADIFIKKGTAFFPGSSLTGNGLLVSDGDIWRRQRRLSNPAFRKAAVQQYATSMLGATQDMMTSQWRQGGVRDVYADFNELTLQITLDALFGFGAPSDRNGSGPGSGLSGAPSSSSSSEAAQIVAAVSKAFEFFTRRAGAAMVLPEWLPTLDNLEFGAAVQQLDRVVYGLIDGRRRELALGGGEPRTDLLQALLTSTDEDGVGMSDQSLRDELMTLLVAGQETSAIALAWTVALLAHNPSVQERAAAEVDHVLQGRAPTAADVRRMPYLEAVALESLRLFSPAYMVGRCACRDVQLGGYSLQAGTTVLVSPYVMHRDTRCWSDPESFSPERWSSWQQEEGYQGFMSFMSSLGPNGAYVPFGAGPRSCIGTGFAMMEVLLVLASALQRYRFSPPASSPMFPEPKPMITLRPETVPISITPRV